MLLSNLRTCAHCCSLPAFLAQYSELAKSFAGEKTGFLAEKEKYADRDRGQSATPAPRVTSTASSHELLCAELPARFKGKQLIVPGPKKANGTTIGYFNPFTYTAETFVDRNSELRALLVALPSVVLFPRPPVYVKTQPLESRKLGFGSRNAKVGPPLRVCDASRNT